jgi:hypothetical protein
MLFSYIQKKTALVAGQRYDQDISKKKIGCQETFWDDFRFLRFS